MAESTSSLKNEINRLERVIREAVRTVDPDEDAIDYLRRELTKLREELRFSRLLAVSRN